MRNFSVILNSLLLLLVSINCMRRRVLYNIGAHYEIDYVCIMYYYVHLILICLCCIYYKTARSCHLYALHMNQAEECATKRLFGVIVWYNNVVSK